MSSGLSLWLGSEPLILASTSTIRRTILESAGIPVEIYPAAIDERAVEKSIGNAGPVATAKALAIAKAQTVALHYPCRVVLGADQTLALGNRTLHKPLDMPEAARHLAELSGREHQLHAALALVRDGEVLWSHVETAHLKVRPLSVDFIDRYLASAGEVVLSSVGAYQVEALGAHLFESIDADHTTIMGLPVFALLQALRTLDLVAR